MLVDHAVVDDVFLDVREGLLGLVIIEVDVHIPATKHCLLFQIIGVEGIDASPRIEECQAVEGGVYLVPEGEPPGAPQVLQQHLREGLVSLAQLLHQVFQTGEHLQEAVSAEEINSFLTWSR